MIEEYNQERELIIKELQDRWLDGMTYAQYCQCIYHTFAKGQKLKLMRYKAMKYRYAEHEALIALYEKHKVHNITESDKREKES